MEWKSRITQAGLPHYKNMKIFKINVLHEKYQINFNFFSFYPIDFKMIIS